MNPPVRMRDKTNAGNVFTVLRGVSEMRADAREHCARSLARSRDIINLYEALNPCRARRAGLLIRYLPGRLWLARGRFDFIIVARGISPV